VSGQPALKMSRVRAEPAAPEFYGFFVAAQRPRALDAGYWALARAGEGWRGELAWFNAVDDWAGWMRSAFGLDASRVVETATDAREGRRHFALVEDGRLVAALFVSREPVLVARQWAAGLLDSGELSAAKVLAGRPGADMPDPGAIVCACHSVGINTINAAIVAGCSSVGAVGAATRAGTNCGSCRAEIGLLLDARPLAAAE
jgi:assimilatory nitrate reductase catalytic subunit